MALAAVRSRARGLGAARLRCLRCRRSGGRSRRWPGGRPTVFAFSQSEASGENPQVYQFAPDINIRAIQNGPPSATRSAITTLPGSRAITKRASSSWVAGRPASSSRRTSPPPRSSTICRRATRTTCRYRTMRWGSPAARAGQHVQPEVPQLPTKLGQSPNRRRRRRTLFRRSDLGVSGGQKYGFNGNEGFDDYAIAEFNRYLLNK
jgi:hypothetical protein